jgi:hypothetical protein
MDQSSVSYVGTVIGVTLGTTYLANTLLFTNLAFIIDMIEVNELASGIFLSTLIILANVVLYKNIKKDLMTFRCIKRCFPDKIKSRRVKIEEY